jgi:hypothetical protein
MVAVPLFAPAVAVSTPTRRLLLLVAPAARRPMEPVVVIPAVAPPRDAFRRSEYPSFAAGFVRLKAWVAVPPTRWLARVTGSGVWALAAANR